MKYIGGFFELEAARCGEGPHPQAHALSTGRACLTAMLLELRPRLVRVPFYSCDAMLQPFEKLGIATRYYAIDECLFPRETSPLGQGEFFLWVDFFGVCAQHTETLKARYAGRLLIDDTHNFFRQGHAGFWSFTSARKSFGVPDGAYLYAAKEVAIEAERFAGISLEPGVLRGLGRQAEAYAAYRAYERSLDCAVRRISALSEGLLCGVDLEHAAEARRANFTFLHGRLGAGNGLALDTSLADVPFCYPYLPARTVDRNALNAQGIFVPSLWSDTRLRAEEAFGWEKCLSAELLPLPIDHRYTAEDMERVADYLVQCR